jgi:hypothetical protein
MKYLFRLAVFAAIVMAFSHAAFSQQSISESKEKLISEVISVTKLNDQFGKMMDAMLAEMDRSYPISFKAAVDADTNLTPEQKKSLKETVSIRYLSFSKRFRERIANAIDYPAYIREAVYPLYDRFYSEAELRDLIAFYRTTTGQKLVETMPELLAASTKASNEILVPKLIPIIQQLLQEDLESLSAPPKAKSN